MNKLTRLSYGGTAAIVTSMGLIVGLGAAGDKRAAIVVSLILVAVADNLTDSIAIHVYQESEKLESRQAFGSTITNFLTRILVSSSFVALAILLPLPYVMVGAVVWGMLLLGVLTYFVARERGAAPGIEIVKHLASAIVVIGVSRAIGTWIVGRFS
jgi:VIT1/CCC1 family predicted Fe2+/Mn2+ transporter